MAFLPRRSDSYSAAVTANSGPRCPKGHSAVQFSQATVTPKGTDREVSKQWLEASSWRGFLNPWSSIVPVTVSRPTRGHRQHHGGDGAMGQQHVHTLRIYNHPQLQQIREAMNKRNEAVQ